MLTFNSINFTYIEQNIVVAESSHPKLYTEHKLMAKDVLKMFLLSV